VEWLGLVLMAALVLGGLGAAARRAPAQEREFGGMVAHRIRCAAASGCPAGGAERRAVTAPPVAVRRPGERPTRAEAVDVLRRLRRAAGLTKKLWIVCLGWRRYALERDRPRAPNEAISVDDALDVVDRCFNPLGFLDG